MEHEETNEPVLQRVKARDVVPYEWAVWCTVEGRPRPFANTIEHVKWTEDGQRLSFMLGTHNFYSAAPDDELELVPCTPFGSSELQASVREEHAHTIANRPRPTVPCAACHGTGKTHG